MSDEGDKVVVYSTVTPAEREALAKILDRLEGTEIQRTGDIALEYGGKRYVVKSQEGGHTGAAVVDRPRGQEVSNRLDGEE